MSWIAKALFRLSILAFVLFYPMLISIYVTLPLFIGFAGYLLLRGLEGDGWRFILLPILYLVNLEINLSLPIFLSLIAVLLHYLFIYPSLIFLKRCPICIAIISVLAIDMIYGGLIMIYDFIFTTSSVTINSQLLYSLIMDIVAAVLL